MLQGVDEQLTRKTHEEKRLRAIVDRQSVKMAQKENFARRLCRDKYIAERATRAERKRSRMIEERCASHRTGQLVQEVAEQGRLLRDLQVELAVQRDLRTKAEASLQRERRRYHALESTMSKHLYNVGAPTWQSEMLASEAAHRESTLELQAELERIRQKEQSNLTIALDEVDRLYAELQQYRAANTVPRAEQPNHAVENAQSIKQLNR